MANTPNPERIFKVITDILEARYDAEIRIEVKPRVENDEK